MATFTYTIIIQEDEPASPSAGWMWLKETTGAVKMYVGGAWETIVFA